MHIPDGVLDPATCLGTAAISAGTVAYALRRVRAELCERSAPLMGVTAACVFAAQMLNFPVPGGTSGHILGSVLAAVLVGPWAGIVVMTIVLLVQCFLFQDGGVTALGANILNMAIVGSGVGYAIYDLVRQRIHGIRGLLAGAMIGSWFSVMIGATACSLEISLGGQFRLSPTLGAMLLVHSVTGIGEALIAGLALSYVWSVRPDLIYRRPTRLNRFAGSGQILTAGLALALFMAVVASPFASSLPDGLEATLAKLGFDSGADNANSTAPPASYGAFALNNLPIAGSLAGMVGTFIVFGLALALGPVLAGRPAFRHSPAGNSHQGHQASAPGRQIDDAS